MAILPSEYPLLGLFSDGSGDEGRALFYGDSHLLTVARAGAGKNRCVILPNLIAYPGSVLVLDPKGENATITARWRKKFGSVKVFDPFKVIKDVDLPYAGRASFDPIAFIKKSASPISAAQMIGDALIIPSEKDPHWSQAAKLIIAAVLLFVATSPALDAPDVVNFCGPRRRTMRMVWNIIADQRYDGLQIDMVASPDPFISNQGSVLSGLRYANTPEGVKLVPVLNGKENAAKLSTLMTQCLGLFSEPGIMDALEGESVDFGTMQRETVSVYIVLPGSLASVHSRFMRLIIRAALSDIEDAGLYYPNSDGSRRPSTLFLLDEFATLGRFPVVTEAMGRMRGYGLKFWTFVQTASQLREHYGDTWEQIAANAGVVQYFGGTMDGYTADWFSKKTGEKTEVATGRGSSTAPASGVSTNESTFQRPVMYPSQVATFPQGKQVLKFLEIDGPIEAVMMYRDNPDHFPAFARWNAKPERKVPVYKPAPPKPSEPHSKPVSSASASVGTGTPKPAVSASAGSRMVIYCPADGQSLRVPVDRGKIRVSCPCGHKWEWSPPDMLAAE